MPVDLTAPRQHGPVAIRLVKQRDARILQSELLSNRGWLRPWEATSPDGPVSFDMRVGVRRLLQQYRDGGGVPFVMEYDGEIAGQLNVWGIARGSLSSATIGYWVSERFAGRGITPTSVALATELCDTLISEGVEDLHFYTLNRPHLTRDVCHALGLSPEVALEKVA